jgi:hypothetical protein
LSNDLPPRVCQSIVEARQELAIRAERQMPTAFSSDMQGGTQTTNETNLKVIGAWTTP